MINALIVNEEKDDCQSLIEMINGVCPQLNISACTNSFQNACFYIKKIKPQLVVLDIEIPSVKGFEIVNHFPCLEFETIILSNSKEKAYQAIKHCAVGFVLKPVQREELILAINNAEQRILFKEQNKRLNAKQPSCVKDIIGIPAIEGLEFIPISNIIRCEGLQKCTRVITTERQDIISSYNIGEFKKLLEPCGFYAPHKSHLINLRKIKKFHKDGTIKMVDLSSVPVSRRRKADFLTRVMHL